ncbi:MAG: hypothetical protein A2341_26250 [Deltaproteobacteria bacterium RIFOXYB12_FULL_58_9]|nr:MAG: hypothetical protein A2341_26250 [Deltaproteobacteria bacterium RIFOXYB12_FULL_58_9]
MSPPKLLRLALIEVLAHRTRGTIAAIGIALGVTVLLVIAGLGLGTRDVVLKEVVRELPVDTIEVIPRTLNLGLFEIGTSALLDATPIDVEALNRFASLDSVAAAYPKLEVNLPMGAQGGARFFGRRLYTDLFMTGLPPELLAEEVGENFRDNPDFLPVVISDQLLEIYNSSVAPSLRLPRLTAHTLEGFEFEIVFGRSLMLGNRGAKQTGVERARIVGVSRYAMRLGVSVPLQTAQRLLTKYGDPDVAPTYRSILLRARSPAEVPAITDAVRAAGLAVDETAERTSNILGAATALASLVGLLVLVLAALNIAHSFFAALSEQRRELAVLRAVGATRLDLVLLVLSQAAIVGLSGGVIGALGAHLCALLIDWAAAMWLPDFPFMPDSFFLLPGWLNAAALVAAVIAAVLGALWPALRAAQASLVASLSEV